MIHMTRIQRTLSKEEVEHIAWLARIELSDEEKELFTYQFNTIIDYFRVIDEADTTDVKPTLYLSKVTNVLREDVVEESLSTEAALANAPMKKEGYFKASKIV